MTTENSIENLDFNFKLFKGMLKGNLNYIYRGVFNHSITDNVLELAESNIMDAEQSSSVRKKVYNIVVESLQNITKHQESDKDNIDNSAIFAVQRKGEDYFVTTGNSVTEEAIIPLRSRLEMINSMSKDELRAFYKARLTTGQISDKGGAGLGLIDMARKSGSKLSYDFKKQADKSALFYLHAKVSGKKGDNSEPKSNALQFVTSLHKTLNTRNILLILNGYFSQESMMKLLQILEVQISDQVRVRKRMYLVMVEIVQNIIKHGAEYDTTESGKPGMFYISSAKDRFLLNSGNYIYNTNVPQLTKNINYVNSLNASELEDYYGKKMMNFEEQTSKGAGLGLIDLRIRTENKIKYNLKRVNTEISFLSMEATINKR